MATAALKGIDENGLYFNILMGYFLTNDELRGNSKNILKTRVLEEQCTHFNEKLRGDD